MRAAMKQSSQQGGENEHRFYFAPIKSYRDKLEKEGTTA
jgi:hypothetical protein